jgi:glycosyltransferase involved in cell wall biosynthesis
LNAPEGLGDQDVTSGGRRRGAGAFVVAMAVDESVQLAVEVSVVVPTRNESGNVTALVQRLDAALGDTNAEIVFVDDSDDDTPQHVRRIARTVGRPVRVLHRSAGERTGGLGSAVLTGLRECAGEWAVVMDGDLQHPPEVVPELIAAGRDADADIVVASRHVGNGSAAGLASFGRTAASGMATTLTKAVFPLRLRGYSDPMSGFFAVRPASLDLDRLRPNGFKILLEILARSSRLRGCEHPFSFGSRHSGESKASWREGMLLVRRLLGLRLAAWLGRRGSVIAAFLAVGLSGIVVNTAALWLLVELLHSPVLLGATLATQASTTWNFLLTDRLVFRGPKARRWPVRYLGFAAVNNAVLLARLPLLAVLVHQAGLNYVLANALTLAAAFAARFVVSDRVLFSRGNQMTTTVEPTTSGPAREFDEGANRPVRDAERSRFGPVDVIVDLREDGRPRVRRRESAKTWHYAIHGIVTIDSSVPLPELEGFAAEPSGPADIEIRAGRFDGSRLRSRSRVTQFAAAPAVCYEEQLGRFGCDFYVDMTDNIQVTVGPLLVRSPHVLYTNVVEALLRFVLVSRGYMLLHSACLELDGRGLLMSALTDTGKTGTVLRLLRENPSRFLSDDMTIMDSTGMAFSYPKPLTISQHTLRAVQAGDLSRAEWRRLRVQSRVHSREGRGIGVRLGEMNLPIMSLNAATQVVIPPPKYVVDRLVPCQHATSVQVRDLFVIERGEFRIENIAPDGLLDELIANTDDAYGFPPFRYFAPALVVGGAAYEELRAQERRILDAAMSGVRARRLATPDFTWADHIPQLLADGRQIVELGARRTFRANHTDPG